MYPRLIARELRARGHDAVSVHDEPVRGAVDEAVLEYAHSEQRAVVTENVRDFRPLADALLRSGRTHSGLILTTDKRWPRSDPGGLISALDRLLRVTKAQPVDVELWL
jgi:predicted nuclease of predicted toxin-antitoxin system